MSTSEDMKAVIELAVAIGGMKADVERLTSELAEARTERAKLHDMLIIAEGQRDQAKMRAEKAEAELVSSQMEAEAEHFLRERVIAERDELLKVYEAAEDFIRAQGTEDLAERHPYLMLCSAVGAYNQQRGIHESLSLWW